MTTLTVRAPRIAIAGKMKSGKSTLAEALEVEYSLDRDSFADPIRQALAILGIEKGHPLYRPGAQYIGTDLVRDYDRTWWVNLLAARHPTQSALDRSGMLIDDVRFPNELEWAEDSGFLTVKVEVSEATQLARAADPDRLAHASETALDAIPNARWGLVIPEATTVAARVALVGNAWVEKEIAAGRLDAA